MKERNLLLLDGAMGTMLQKAGMKPGTLPEVFGMQHPEIVLGIHQRYIEAGSRVIYANTFGANSRKYEGSGFSVKDVIAANIATARKAASSFPGLNVKTALDVGPVGELMEPLGTLSFDEAYECFREIVCAGETAGADLVIFETMTDLNEVRTAVLAAKENTSLPVWVTMTFEKTGRTFAGTDPAAMALTLDALGVEAVGVNCSLGPGDLVPIVEKIRSHTDLPVIVKPNAGLPDPRTGLYAMTPERFADEMTVYPKMGITILGGCCGTRPSFIQALGGIRSHITPEDNSLEASGQHIQSSDTTQEAAGDGSHFSGAVRIDPESVSSKPPVRNGVCSAGRVTYLDGRVRVVGERINPTGKKRFQQALREHDMNYIMKCAIEQADDGADILDINVGLPGADEPALMKDVVCAVQSVTDLPLQIDSTNPEAIEAGLRAACGRVIVNSVNAEEENCRRILPIVRKYGACVIGLALEKSGMPKNAEERIRNIRTILKFTDEYGIPRKDVIADCLALTVSAQQEQAMETLRAVRYAAQNLGVHCTLGVSNISFGLPQRKHATVSFLTQAMYCGVDLPIINPNQVEIMDAVAAFRALSGQDVSCMDYIARFAGRQEMQPLPASQSTRASQDPRNLSDSPDISDFRKLPDETGRIASLSGADSSNAGRMASLSGTDSSNTGRMVSLSGMDSFNAVQQAILRGLGEEVRQQAALLLDRISAMEIVENYLIPALDEVGSRYEKQLLFLPQLINAANAASAGFELIKDRIAQTGAGTVSKGKVVLATVEGDIHDIGKNIVKVVLENYGYTVIDLGRNVPPQKVADAAKDKDVKLAGLSALMTTTLPAMEETIRLLKESGCGVKTVVGGAVVTERYAKEIGADFYAKDAKATVDAARQIYGS